MGLTTQDPRLKGKPGRFGCLSLESWVLGLTLAAVMCLTVDAVDQQPSVSFAAPKEQPVIAKLISEHGSVQLPGNTRVGVLFTIKDGWHIYAEDPGDAGMPTKVTWHRASGEIFSPVQWPPAENFTDPGDIHTHGYRGTVVLASQLHITPKEPAADPLLVWASVEWLACKEVCIPGSADVKLSLPIRVETPQRTPEANLFGPEPAP